MDRPVPTLEIFQPRNPTPRFAVEIPIGFDEVVGREPPAGITIRDDGVSRHHARLLRDNTGVWVEDLRSTNGTFINGHPVTSRRALRDGDQLAFGGSVGVFHDIREPAPHSAPQGQPGGGGCPQCGAVNAPDLWFCQHCGQQRRPILVPPLAEAAGGPEPRLERLLTPHGEVRGRPFRQARRAGNGGRRVGYNESLAIPTILFRFLLTGIVLLAIVVAVALADGASVPFGLGN